MRNWAPDSVTLLVLECRNKQELIARVRDGLYELVEAQASLSVFSSLVLLHCALEVPNDSVLLLRWNRFCLFWVRESPWLAILQLEPNRIGPGLSDYSLVCVLGIKRSRSCSGLYSEHLETCTEPERKIDSFSISASLTGRHG